MDRDFDEAGIIGSKTPRVVDFGPLFATPAPLPAVRKQAPPTHWELEAVRVARDTHARLDKVPYPSPADFARLASDSDVAERLLALCERVANCLLDYFGRMAVWEVRVVLTRMNLIGPKDKLDCLGRLGERMDLEAIGLERPPLLPELVQSHRNRNTIWRRRGDVRRISAA